MGKIVVRKALTWEIVVYKIPYRRARLPSARAKVSCIHDTREIGMSLDLQFSSSHIIFKVSSGVHSSKKNDVSEP